MPKTKTIPDPNFGTHTYFTQIAKNIQNTITTNIKPTLGDKIRWKFKDFWLGIMKVIFRANHATEMSKKLENLKNLSKPNDSEKIDKFDVKSDMLKSYLDRWKNEMKEERKLLKTAVNSTADSIKTTTAKDFDIVGRLVKNVNEFINKQNAETTLLITSFENYLKEQLTTEIDTLNPEDRKRLQTDLNKIGGPDYDGRFRKYENIKKEIDTIKNPPQPQKDPQKDLQKVKEQQKEEPKLTPQKQTTEEQPSISPLQPAPDSGWDDLFGKIDYTPATSSSPLKPAKTPTSPLQPAEGPDLLSDWFTAEPTPTAAQPNQQPAKPATTPTQSQAQQQQAQQQQPLPPPSAKPAQQPSAAALGSAPGTARQPTLQQQQAQQQKPLPPPNAHPLQKPSAAAPGSAPGSASQPILQQQQKSEPPKAAPSLAGASKPPRAPIDPSKLSDPDFKNYIKMKMQFSGFKYDDLTPQDISRALDLGVKEMEEGIPRIFDASASGIRARVEALKPEIVGKYAGLQAIRDNATETQKQAAVTYTDVGVLTVWDIEKAIDSNQAIPIEDVHAFLSFWKGDTKNVNPRLQKLFPLSDLNLSNARLEALYAANSSRLILNNFMRDNDHIKNVMNQIRIKEQAQQQPATPPQSQAQQQARPAAAMQTQAGSGIKNDLRTMTKEEVQKLSDADFNAALDDMASHGVDVARLALGTKVTAGQRNIFFNRYYFNPDYRQAAPSSAAPSAAAPSAAAEQDEAALLARITEEQDIAEAERQSRILQMEEDTAKATGFSIEAAVVHGKLASADEAYLRELQVNYDLVPTTDNGDCMFDALEKILVARGDQRFKTAAAMRAGVCGVLNVDLRNSVLEEVEGLYKDFTYARTQEARERLKRTIPPALYQEFEKRLLQMVEYEKQYERFIANHRHELDGIALNALNIAWENEQLVSEHIAKPIRDEFSGIYGNRDLFIRNFKAQSINLYIEGMKTSNTYGGDLELYAASKIINQPIVVHFNRQEIIRDEAQNKDNPLHLFLKTASRHYEGLIPKK